MNATKHEWTGFGKRQVAQMDGEDDGITRASISFLRDHMNRLEKLAMVELLMPRGMQYPDSHVRWIDANGDYLETTGCAWGYAGEGPRGLRSAFALFGLDVPMEKIAAWQYEHVVLNVEADGRLTTIEIKERQI